MRPRRIQLVLTAALLQGRSALQPQSRLYASVTGTAWEGPDTSAPVVSLYTKEGCTLCDVAKGVLSDLREEIPHSLELIDIEDDDQKHSFEAYKYDIPVLKIDNAFWAKHRITHDEARSTLRLATELKEAKKLFKARPGEPNAGLAERNAAAARSKK